MKMNRLFLTLLLPFLCVALALAQVGQHRNDFSIGFNGGLMLSNVGFMPEVPQNLHQGLTGGFSLRYTSEKYFNSVCAIVAEVNYSQVGWRERIWDSSDQPVINQLTGQAEEYARIVNYLQVPFFARLGWGRERRGFQAFFQIGPQLGFYLSEKTDANFDLDHPNTNDRVSHFSGPDIGKTHYSNMYHMPIENKLDYGIAAGLGLEFSSRHLGHFMVEGRYYFGLGNMYGNTKRDYFAKSNLYNIVIKATYLFDIVKSNNPKIK